MKITNHEIELFLLKAEEGSYAQEGVKKQKIAQLPGSKLIAYEDGLFQYTDTYVVAPESERSAGQTVVTYDKVPVWTMVYGGWYPQETIPFLKECLRQAEPSDDFVGCRGPKLVVGEQYRYENHCRHGDFSNFEGEEYIVKKDAPSIRDWTNVLGHHWYKGMSLLPGTGSIASE